MAQQVVLIGALINLYLNNKKYTSVQSVSFLVDYGEESTYGIDCSYPQEIAPTKIVVSGSVQGIRIKYSGGLQASSLRPLFTDIMAGPYISIRIQDRSSGEDILFVPKGKVTKEDHSVTTKGIYKLNFSFIGQVPLFSLDRSN
jgi:hypothetical protein